jgi:hypothetical protein
MQIAIVHDWVTGMNVGFSLMLILACKHISYYLSLEHIHRLERASARSWYL